MDDDLFQSLGGSLMKDLLADLQGDDGEGDGWLSLEQLEKELSQLDDTATTTTTSTGGGSLPLGSLPLPPLPTAASMVVSGQQQFHQQQQLQQPPPPHAQQPLLGVGLLGDVTVTTAPADAWKQSLQKFTALSLDQDFLAADTVRKQQKSTTTIGLPPGFLAEAQDYDATEKVTIKPPPGLAVATAAAAPPPPGITPPAKTATAPRIIPPANNNHNIAIAITSITEDEQEDKEREEQAKVAAASLLPREEQAKIAAASLLPQAAIIPSIPQGKSLPKTPPNSVVVGIGGAEDDVLTGQKARVAARMPKTPRNSTVVSSSADDVADDEESAATATTDADDGGDDIPMMGKVTMGKVTILKREDNKTGETPSASTAAQPEHEPKRPPKTPRNSVMVPDQEAAAAVVAASAAVQGMAMPPPTMAMHGMPPGPPPHHHGMPLQGMLPRGPPEGMPPPPHHMHGMPPMIVPMGGGGPPGGVPMFLPPPSSGGPAWQSGPQPMAPPPPQMRVFCNPHPNAPPIPAQVLESRLMKSRDISYIVHSILKPVLMAGISEHDYDIQLMHRQSGVRPAGPRHNLGRRPGGTGHPKDKNSNINEDPTMDVVQQEMVSREKKSKEWSAKNAALGTVTKSNVGRPRALIASPVLSQDNQDKLESASEQKQRARLWKARIYCDQAYQAYLAVVDIWAKAAPGSVPPQVHAPLIRLMKCLGIAPAMAAGGPVPTQGDYNVDVSVLELFLKLSKGRTLFARIVEQALLPPSAIQAVLPATLEILYKTPVPPENNHQGASADGGDPTDDRCFRALSSVIQTMPSLSGDSVLQCAEIVKAHSDPALSSTARMVCLHALLQRGSAMAAGRYPSSEGLDDFKAQWTETEASFLNILSGI